MRRIHRIEEGGSSAETDKCLPGKHSMEKNWLELPSTDSRLPKNFKLDDTSPSEKPSVRPTHVSVFTPLDLSHSFQASKHRPLPKWMAQLPSNRVKDFGIRRPSAPVRLPSQLNPLDLEADDTPKTPEAFYTPLEQPQNSHPMPSTAPASSSVINGSALRTQRAQSYPERQIPAPKHVSAFPFFQNPRAPLTPAVESSWGGIASPGLVPYSGLYHSEDKSKHDTSTTPNTVFRSTEYTEKYGLHPVEPDTTNEICPICEEPVETSAEDLNRERRGTVRRRASPLQTVKGLNNHTYHIACICCRACRQQYRPKDSMTDWTWVGSSSPYHRTCMIQGAKPMLERLRKRLSMTGIASRHYARPESDAQMLPGLTRPTPDISIHKKHAHEMTAVPVKKPDYIRNLPTLFSPRIGPEPCASCGHALLPDENMLGPNDTKHHVTCLSACTSCGKDFQGQGTAWYAYGRRGLMRGLCQTCWENKQKHVVQAAP
jgi:hypothetical protein